MGGDGRSTNMLVYSPPLLNRLEICADFCIFFLGGAALECSYLMRKLRNRAPEDFYVKGALFPTVREARLALFFLPSSSLARDLP